MTTDSVHPALRRWLGRHSQYGVRQLLVDSALSVDAESGVSWS